MSTPLTPEREAEIKGILDRTQRGYDAAEKSYDLGSATAGKTFFAANALGVDLLLEAVPELLAELSRRPTPEQVADIFRSALMPLSGYETSEAGYAQMLKAKQYNLIIHHLAAKLNIPL